MQHVGIDIIETSRISEAVERWGNSFLERIYTAAELERYRNHPQSLAARFAAKEAVIKVLGIRGKGIGYTQIEILSDAGGKPTLRLYDQAKKCASVLGLTDIAVSLSHSRDYATAVAAGQSIH